MRLHRDLLELCDCHGVSRDTVIGTCIKRRKQRGRRGAAECATSSTKTDMRYGRCFSEAICERKLSELITSLVVENAHPVVQDDGGPPNPSIELVTLRWLFDNLWFCSAQEHWQKDVDFELRRLVSHRGDGSSHTNARSL